MVLARPLAGRKIRPDTPKPKQMLIEFGASLRSIAIFSTIGLFTFALERVGLLPGPRIAAEWGAGWAWASLALMILAHDAYFYWTHRAIHDPRLFRAFHRRHHKSNNPSPFTAYSFDLGEAAINGSFVPLWMILVPTQWWVVGVFMLHQIVRNTLGHSGYELFPARRDGRPLFDFLTTTTHHDLHHAQAGYELRPLLHLVGSPHGHRAPGLLRALRRRDAQAAPAARRTCADRHQHRACCSVFR